MQIKVEKVYGNSKIELAIEVADLKEALFKATIFTQKDQCFLCKSTEISLVGNKDEENNLYLKRHCGKCGAQSSLGTYKGGFGYFWKKWEIWEGKKDSSVNEPF